MPSTTGDGGQSLNVHQLLGRLAPEYLERFGRSMPGRHRQVLKKILSCRTPALGGQMFQCPDCWGFEYRYHSCNDRHCPQCGQTDADAWLQRQGARLLFAVPYFLVTFTIPEALRLLLRSHQRIGLDLFFGVTSRALQDLAANPQRLGAQLGMLGVLHTWARSLLFHPHIHYLIPGGGLSPDGRQWIAARRKFLLHHTALGAHVRTLFKKRLLNEHPQLFVQVPKAVWKEPWNVGCQAAGSGDNALRYLSRYVFKTATGNRKVTLLPEGKVLWTYRQSKTRKFTSIKLESLDWMSRFLQHTLPRSFARVRTFGWLHPAARVRANRVRALLREKPILTAAEKETWQPPADPQTPQAHTPAPLPTPNLPLPARCSAPMCLRCRKVMRLVGTWKAGHRLLYPNRPP
jgi:hypothetical protein